MLFISRVVPDSLMLIDYEALDIDYAPFDLGVFLIACAGRVLHICVASFGPHQMCARGMGNLFWSQERDPQRSRPEFWKCLLRNCSFATPIIPFLRYDAIVFFLYQFD